MLNNHNFFRRDYAEHLNSGKWREVKFDLTPYEPLRNMDLSGLNLKHIDFTGKELENINFNGSDLTQVSFKSAKIKNCSFDKACMKFARLQDADIENNSFVETELSGIWILNTNKCIGNIFKDNDVVVHELTKGRKNRIAIGAKKFKEREAHSQDEELVDMF